MGPMEDMDPIDLSRALGEIPLFKEFQKLVAASRGPINYQIADQIARAVATAGKLTHAPDEHDKEMFESSCRLAELRITEVSGLAASSPTRVEVCSRERWVEANLSGIEQPIGRLAEKLGMQISPVGLPAMPLKGVLDALGPLFMGIQTGLLVGHLSRQALAQFDMGVSLSGTDTIHLNLPNIVEVEQGLGLEPASFRLWLSLHEVAHRFQMTSVAWVRAHLDTLLSDYVENASVDPAEFMSKLEGLTDEAELNRLMSRPEELLPMMLSREQSATMDKIRALLAVLEGHAELLATKAGAPVLPEVGRLKEAMVRRHAEKSSAEKLLERLLGIDLPQQVYRQGITFVERVDSAGHLQTLMSAPETLPTVEEIGDPSKWLSRVAFG